MKQQQDSRRKPDRTPPQSQQAEQSPRDLEQDDSRTASSGGRRNPSNADREGQSGESRQPLPGQDDSRGQADSGRQPSEIAREQDDFGGIGKQDSSRQR